MNDLSILTSFLWWLLFLSSFAIILYDIVAATAKGTSLQYASGKRGIMEPEDEIVELGSQIARAMRRPAGLQVLETQAAETILSAALAARGIQEPKSYRATSDRIIELFKDSEIAEFIIAHLTDSPPRPVPKRSQMLAEFQNMMRILDKVALELA